jgi:hypothetical protein
VGNVKDIVVKGYRQASGGRLKERAQLCLIATEDGRLREVELDVTLACIEDQEHELAFLEDHANQFKNRQDDKWYQVLGERSTIPISLIEKRTDDSELETLINGIFERSTESAKSRKYREAKKNKNWDRFVWLTCGVVSVAVVIAVLQVI